VAKHNGRRIGYRGSEEHQLQEAAAFLELHIEQDPVRDTENCPVGIVKGIQGIIWLEASFTGQSDHAGPSPMSFRHLGKCSHPF
jgi:N-carbamoyl-L-amino-acid hydrolase